MQTTEDSVLLLVSCLRADSTYQPRISGLDEAHVESIVASDPELWPPLLVSPNGDNLYRVIDGFHRFAAAQRLRLQQVPCVVQEGAAYPEAFAANLKHGLPLSLADRKAYVRWLHKHEPQLSYREIGRRTNLFHMTVKATIENGEIHQSKPGMKARVNVVERTLQQIIKLEAAPDARSVYQFIGQFADDIEVAKHLVAVGSAFIEGSKPYIK